MLVFSSPDGCLPAAQSSFDVAEESPEFTRRSPAETGPAGPLVDPLSKYLATIALGDAQAMAKFYRTTISLVLARARTLVAKEDAEEISNDVYVYVWRHALDYDPHRGTVLAWLSIMTRNRAIDCLRRRRRFMVSLDDDQAGTPARALISPMPAAEVLLEQYEWKGAAGRALSRLNPLRRQLLDLSFFQELSHPEIARQVGLPLGTIKSHLRRTLNSMRKNSLAYT